MSVQITQFKSGQASARAETFPRFSFAYAQGLLVGAGSSSYIAPFVGGSGVASPTDVDWIAGAGAFLSFDLIPANNFECSLRCEISPEGITFTPWRTSARYFEIDNPMAGIWLPYWSFRLRVFNNGAGTLTISGCVKVQATE